MPEKRHIHTLYQPQHVVVIYPNNRNGNKTQRVGDKLRRKHGNKRPKGCLVINLRQFDFKNHERNDNRKNAVAEGF